MTEREEGNMIISESVKGNLRDGGYEGHQKDFVDIEWHEAYKRLHKKTTQGGTEIGIRLGTEILVHGLREGDVLWQEDGEIIVVHVPPCEVIVIDIDRHHPRMAHKVCYEIGNKHAALMWGEEEMQFITPYNEPTFQLLSKLHGVQVRKDMRSLDFDKAISATVSSHTH